MKNPVYQIRVKAEMLEFLNEAGPEVVRGWWRQRMSGVVREERALIVAPPKRESIREKAAAPTKTSPKGQAGGPVRGVPADVGERGVVQTDVGRVPAWKVKLDAQLAEAAAREARKGSSVLPGEAAPAAVAAVSTPREAVVDTGYWRDPAPPSNVPVQRVKVFSQTPEQREEKLKMLAGMKLMPQMPPKAEFYPDDEPNEENT